MSTVIGLLTMILTTADGVVRNITSANDITNILARTKDIALSTDQMYTFLDAFIPKIKNRIGAVGLTFRIFGKNRIEDPAVLLLSLPLHLDDQPVYPPAPIPSYVYYSFSLEDALLSRRWQLYGFQIYGEPDGKFFL